MMNELIYRSYCQQRCLHPEVEPERWALIFDNVPEMEERFLKTFVAKLFEAAAEEELPN